MDSLVDCTITNFMFYLMGSMFSLIASILYCVVSEFFTFYEDTVGFYFYTVGDSDLKEGVLIMLDVYSDLEEGTL